jgi:hypothetical protein
MRIRRTLLGIFLILFGYDVTCAPSLAGEPINYWKSCLDTLSCLGKVDMIVTKAARDDAVGKFVLSSFSNGEYYFEDLSTGQPRRLLHFPDDGGYLYYGVRGTKEADAFVHTYQRRVGKVVFGVLAMLASGFPDGVDAIPDAWESRNVHLGGLRYQVSARKAGPNVFLFRTQGPDWHVAGEWVLTKTSPWPDGEPLNGWTSADGTPTPSLGEVRKSPTVPISARAEQKPPSGVGVDFESMVLVMLPKGGDLSSLLVDFGYLENEESEVFVFDFNGDSLPDFLVQSSKRLCGPGRCVYALVDAKTATRIGDLIGPPIFILDQKINGYPVIQSYGRLNAGSGNFVTYVFDGTKYQIVATVFVEGKSLEELLKGLSVFKKKKSASRGGKRKVVIRDGALQFWRPPQAMEGDRKGEGMPKESGTGYGR